jgi:iron uptake system component EfeO
MRMTRRFDPRCAARSAAALALLLSAACGEDQAPSPTAADASASDAARPSPVASTGIDAGVPRADGGLDAGSPVPGSEAAAVDVAPPLSDVEQQARVVGGMHASLLAELERMKQAAVELQAAAPTPLGRGWDADADAAAITAMRAAWVRMRTAYEHIEGALAPLFPDLDASLDARYDDYLADIGPAGDADLFDDEGVTGMHGLERILWASEIPARVITFEASLPGYLAAGYPASEQQAEAFKSELCAKAVADTESLIAQWTPAGIDLSAALRGLIALMSEQREKVNKASSNEEESRYSQRTMTDIRENLVGTQAVFALFRPWLQARTASDGGASGAATDAAIQAGFAELEALYASVQGDAIPPPPASWSAEAPAALDLESPFGKLWSGVRKATDPTSPMSIVSHMNRAAVLLGYPEFAEE